VNIKQIDRLIKIITAGAIGLWLFFIYTFATTGWPMIRQLLVCMITTMVVFGVMSLAVGELKKRKAALESQNDQ